MLGILSRKLGKLEFECTALTPYAWRVLCSKPDPLHLILREPLLGAVIELGGARALVRRHLLRVFERTAIGKISGDAGRAIRMIADRRMNGIAPARAINPRPGGLDQQARRAAGSSTQASRRAVKSGHVDQYPKLCFCACWANSSIALSLSACACSL